MKLVHLPLSKGFSYAKLHLTRRSPKTLITVHQVYWNRNMSDLDKFNPICREVRSVTNSLGTDTSRDRGLKVVHKFTKLNK